MKVLYDFRPTGSADTVTVTSVSAHASFPANNLKTIKPAQAWKTNYAAGTFNPATTDGWIKYDFGGTVAFDTVFLNRFNFAAYKIQSSPDDATWTDLATVSGMTKDEIYDENYMHRWHELTFNARYLRIYIAAQTPLFETTYFKIGNCLLGNRVTIKSPQQGFQVTNIPKNAMVEFESGYESNYKLGRTKRGFSGSYDKMTSTEKGYLRFTMSPFVMYFDLADYTQAYLVKNVKEPVDTYEEGATVSTTFEYVEIP